MLRDYPALEGSLRRSCRACRVCRVYRACRGNFSRHGASRVTTAHRSCRACFNRRGSARAARARRSCRACFNRREAARTTRAARARRAPRSSENGNGIDMGKHRQPRVEESIFVGQRRTAHQPSRNHKLRCHHIQSYHAGLAPGLQSRAATSTIQRGSR